MAYEKADLRVRYTKMVIKESLLELMKEQPISKITVTIICRSYEICKYIKANSKICEVLFSENGDKELLERILYISHDLNIEKWRKEVKYFDQKLFDKWYTFTAYGSIAIIKDWVNGGMKESPSKIAAFINKATDAVSKDFY